MTPRYLALAAISLILISLADQAAAETRVGGPITGKVRWTKAQSPYIVVSDIEIQPGATLTIDPGCVLRFKPNLADQRGLRPFDLEIDVYGTLEAQGADNDSIFFTSDAIEPTWSDWGGIIVANPQAKAVLSRVAIEFAHMGVWVTEGDLDLSRSAVRYGSEKGVCVMRSRARLSKNYITGIGNFAGTGCGIYLVKAPDVVLEDNIVIGAQTGLSCESGSSARIARNLFSLCKVYGITVTNSSPEITGNTSTQNEFGLLLMGNATPKVKDNNFFDNGTYDLKVMAYTPKPDKNPVEIDVIGNWWGRYTVEVTYDKIEDADDDPSIGARAIIEPVRKEAYRSE